MIDYPAEKWGSTNCEDFSKLIFDLIQSNKASSLFDFTTYYRDMDLQEAVHEACFDLGLDENNYSATITFSGHEAEVSLH
jgi:hypothetical protein